MPILTMFCLMVHTVTLLDGPALKSAPICGKVARLSCLIFHFSRRCPRSCMVFIHPQRCHRFVILSDFRYPRYSCEIVACEKPNFIATPQMLCPISRAPTMTPVKTHINLDNL
ncbi:uncharacterized protein TNCV_661071 [Trichonephila clavipes]|nr:uncharacterized protein TNCV_661071 [Trichonephila clavipes]